MSQKLATLQAALEFALGDKIKRLVVDRGEITITVSAADYLAAMQQLRRDHDTPRAPSSCQTCYMTLRGEDTLARRRERFIRLQEDAQPVRLTASPRPRAAPSAAR